MLRLENLIIIIIVSQYLYITQRIRKCLILFYSECVKCTVDQKCTNFSKNVEPPPLNADGGTHNNFILLLQPNHNNNHFTQKCHKQNQITHIYDMDKYLSGQRKSKFFSVDTFKIN